MFSKNCQMLLRGARQLDRILQRQQRPRRRRRHPRTRPQIFLIDTDDHLRRQPTMRLTQRTTIDNRSQHRVKGIMISLGHTARIPVGSRTQRLRINTVRHPPRRQRVVRVIHSRLRPHRQHHIKFRPRRRSQMPGQLRHQLAILPIGPQITALRPITLISELTIRIKVGDQPGTDLGDLRRRELTGMLSHRRLRRLPHIMRRPMRNTVHHFQHRRNMSGTNITINKRLRQRRTLRRQHLTSARQHLTEMLHLLTTPRRISDPQMPRHERHQRPKTQLPRQIPMIDLHQRPVGNSIHPTQRALLRLRQTNQRRIVAPRQISSRQIIEQHLNLRGSILRRLRRHNRRRGHSRSPLPVRISNDAVELMFECNGTCPARQGGLVCDDGSNPSSLTTSCVCA